MQSVHVPEATEFEVHRRDRVAFRVVEKKGARSTAIAGSEVQGLCMTCNLASTCIYRNDSRLPVVFCEEFDCEEMSPTGAEHAEVMATGPEPACANGTHPARSEYKGLCVTCAHRDTCTFAMRDVGVWHCEEFE
jgi:hypothetical protein